MTPNEIKAFAAKVNMDSAYAGKRVRVKAPAEKGGKYLSIHGRFDADKKDAFEYDYTKDKVGDQVRQLIEAGMPVEVELAN